MTEPDKQPFWIKSASFLFDRLIPVIRPLLWPIYILTRIWDSLSRLTRMLANEYLKSRFKECGTGVRIHGKCSITAPGNLEIGDNVHINTNAFIRAEGGLTIEDNVHISRNLVIYTMNHNYEGRLLPYDASHLLRPVRIGRNAWIGMNVMITPGVSIGEGAIIGMGTTVTRDVAPLEIIGNAPQRVLKSRDADHYRKLNEKSAYSGMSGYPLDGG